MRAWPVARSIFDAPYVREANEGTTSWINSGGIRWSLQSNLCRQLRKRFIISNIAWESGSVSVVTVL